MNPRVETIKNHLKNKSKINLGKHGVIIWIQPKKRHYIVFRKFPQNYIGIFRFPQKWVPLDDPWDVAWQKQITTNYVQTCKCGKIRWLHFFVWISFIFQLILLTEEILHHLLLMKPYEKWDILILHINWLAGFLPSTVPGMFSSRGVSFQTTWMSQEVRING